MNVNSLPEVPMLPLAITEMPAPLTFGVLLEDAALTTSYLA